MSDYAFGQSDLRNLGAPDAGGASAMGLRRAVDDANAGQAFDSSALSSGTAWNRSATSP